MDGTTQAESLQAMQDLHLTGQRDRMRSDPDLIKELVAKVRGDGFVIVTDLIDADDVERMRSELLALMGPRGRNDFEGFSTQRVYGVMARTSVCDPLVEHPLVLDLVEQCLAPNYLLSQLVAINIEPGEDAQALHHDDALYPLPRPRPPVSAASIWAIDEFTSDNGGTIVIPASHSWGNEAPQTEDVPISVEMPAGSMVFFLGTLWHGGGTNVSDTSRLGVTAQYCEPWARTVENFSLSMPRERVAATSQHMQSMLGYSIHSTLMGYVDGRHPRKLLK